ncbi:hypothetical protein CDAR_253501 [Caerostris darwini]|uniref:Uncharacterized protein n=1 Tax=Caerostris darwini TaxID=1538125 RepID=A0AAV4MKQ6_9ARAC|nr:hypothetical protein CDAR_253501 [Caerostris darwini]
MYRSVRYPNEILAHTVMLTLHHSMGKGYSVMEQGMFSDALEQTCSVFWRKPVHGDVPGCAFSPYPYTLVIRLQVNSRLTRENDLHSTQYNRQYKKYVICC